ncbi:hypothetical protein G7Y89_g10725 [Cudoniella acicularis]|uniref:Uncharacterized protein n=1 Tax=Cudoniella acicularis TaxID=354080 RepID=A0A8H4REI6_9HELO|nr:hypothetical protein G7Y89_g10725 [Cudoniella acicularis]
MQCATVLETNSLRRWEDDKELGRIEQKYNHPTYTELAKANVIAARAEKVLRSLPRGLAPLYQKMLFQLLENDDNELVEIALNILRDAIISFKTSTLLELTIAASLPPEYRKDIPTLRDYVLQCGSFLQIQDSTDGNYPVHLAHQSAIKFLAPEICLLKILFLIGRA